jgi:hypothetical protein
MALTSTAPWAPSSVRLSRPRLQQHHEWDHRQPTSRLATVPFQVASHPPIGDGHSYEATATAALRRPIDDSTGVRDEGHASRTARRCADWLLGVRRAYHPGAGQLMSAASRVPVTRRPFCHQRTTGGRKPAAACWRHLNPRVDLYERRPEPIRVSVEPRQIGRRDELRRHPFWGARKKSRQRLARRKCRRSTTLGENDNNPQISLWVVY